MPFALITAPASEPVSLTEAKTHLRVEHTIDDTLITGLIIAARSLVEERARRGLVTQTWELVLNRFPVPFTDPNYQIPGGPVIGGPFLYGTGLNLTSDQRRIREMAITLPRGGLASVGSVKYIDGTGTQQTLALTTDYVLDTSSEPGRVLPAFGTSWPTARDQWDAVRVRYDVGWAAASVPRPLFQAVLMVVSQLYKEPVIANDILGALPSQLQVAVENLVAPYRLLYA